MFTPAEEKEEAVAGGLNGKTLEGKKERWDVKLMKLHVLVTGEEGEIMFTTQVWAHHKGGVMMGVVVEVVLDERWGFDESVPLFGDTLETP